MQFIVDYADVLEMLFSEWVYDSRGEIRIPENPTFDDIKRAVCIACKNTIVDKIIAIMVFLVIFSPNSRKPSIMELDHSHPLNMDYNVVFVLLSERFLYQVHIFELLPEHIESTLV